MDRFRFIRQFILRVSSIFVLANSVLFGQPTALPHQPASINDRVAIVQKLILSLPKDSRDAFYLRAQWGNWANWANWNNWNNWANFANWNNWSNF
jgi:hypothetical protein